MNSLCDEIDRIEEIVASQKSTINLLIEDMSQISFGPDLKKVKNQYMIVLKQRLESG